jgi:predicted transcriptional regulator
MKNFCTIYDRIKLKEIFERQERNRVLLYSLCNLKTCSSDILKTITVKIDFENEDCRRMVSTNKSTFYKQIKELVSEGILIKIKPKTFIVRMDYICMMTDTQKKSFRNGEYNYILPLELVEYFNK